VCARATFLGHPRTSRMSVTEHPSQKNMSERTLAHDLDHDRKEFEEVDPETPSVPSQADDYPDGGYKAWLVVFGTVCITFST